MPKPECSEALQMIFRFEPDERDGLLCDCSSARLKYVVKKFGVLWCKDAPWYCPKVQPPAANENPGASNTGVRLENLDQTSGR
jgi:hypothetical protein